MSVLPNKYVPIDYSIIGISSILLEVMSENDTISSLWEKVSLDKRIRTFDRYADALSLLFAVKLIDMQGGVIVGRPTS
jgi:hypothetical protein